MNQISSIWQTFLKMTGDKYPRGTRNLVQLPGLIFVVKIEFDTIHAANMVLIWAASLALGVLSHLFIFIHKEWHLQVAKVVLIHFLSVACLWYMLSVVEPKSVSFASKETASVFASYLVGLYSSIVIYRLAFHPLRHLPGPRLAPLTKLYHVWCCRNKKNYQILDSWYKKYGRVIRIGPNEVAVFHPAALEAVDGQGTSCTASAWYDLLRPMSSPLFARDPIEHSTTSKVWLQALSSSAVKEYIPRLKRQVAELDKLVALYHGEPILINDAFSWYSFDSMGEFTFNESFHMVTSRQYHKAIVRQNSALSLLGCMNSAVWLAHFAFVFMPFLPVVKDWFAMVAFCKAQMQKRLEKKSTEPDLADWFIREFENDSQGRDKKEMRDLLDGNTVTAVVAGSTTITLSLIMLFYYLAKYPMYTESLYDEIASCKDPLDTQVLAELPLLNSIINESMRLLPAGLTVGWRDTGPKGVWIEEIFIPPNTTIVAPRYTVSRLESAFERPHEFISERWYSKPELIKDKRAFAPFGVGKRSCVGRKLALVQIRLVVVMLLLKYRITFAEDETGETLWRDMKDQVSALPGPCRLRFLPR